MSTVPGRLAPERLFRGTRFASAEREAAFRQHRLPDVARNGVYFLLAFQLGSLLFVMADLKLAGPPGTFAWLLAMRLSTLTLVLGLAAALLRATRPARVDALLLAGILLTAVMMTLIHASRPRSHFLNAVVDVTIVNAVWTILPLPFGWQALVAAFFTVMEVLVFRFMKDPLPQIGATAIVNAYVISHLVGAAVAWRFHRVRRREYLALTLEAENRRALAAAHSAAEAGSRAKSAFLAGVSHEILTPLNAILGFSEVLLREEVQPRSREAAEAIRSSGRALHALLVDVLELARGEAAEVPLSRERCELPALLADVERMMAPRSAEKGISFRLQTAGAPPPALLLDGARLRQVLLNLTANAIRFTDSGGVTLSCAAGEPAGGRVELALSVVDTGHGIPAGEQEAIFAPFQQGKGVDRARVGGVGLGLAVSRRLVERMGGRLTLESAPGRGSSFRIALPRVELAPEVAAAVARGGERTLRPASLLVVDDERWNRALVAAWLRDQPVRVEEAAGVEEAVAALRRSRPDALLLDLRMPGGGGEAVLRFVRDQPRLARLPVIAWSAHQGPSPGGAGEVDAWVAKPTSREALLGALERVLGSAPEGGVVRGAVEPGAAQGTAPAAPTLAEAGVLAELLQAAAALGCVPHAGRARELADRAYAIGAACGATELSDWADELRVRARSLDAEGLRGVLATLPGMVERLAPPAGG